MPVPTPLPIAIPVGATARRPDWDQLPPFVRDGLAGALGSAVVESHSQNAGFTPGFASRVRLADGRRYFVKATDRALDWLAEAYATETEVLAVLPPALPAPRVHYRLDLVGKESSWLVVVFEQVAGRSPRRPWTLVEAEPVLAAVTAMSRLLTPVPAGRTWGALAGESPAALSAGSRARLGPGLAGRLDELVAAAPDLLLGSTLMHFDLRDDNVLLGEDGEVRFCDWNWPVSAPVWADAACLAIAMVGDGLVPAAVLDRSELLAAADPEAVDCLLALLLAMFLDAGSRAEVETSPHLRAHQRWYADVLEGWLRVRARAR